MTTSWKERKLAAIKIVEVLIESGFITPPELKEVAEQYMRED